MRPASMRLTDGVLGVPVGGALAGIGILVLTASLSSPATESFTAHLAGDSIRRGLSITRRITGFLSAATTLVSATTSAPTTTTGDPERTMSQAPNTLAAFTADQVLRVDFIPGPGSPVYVVSAEAASTEALEQAAEASMAAVSTAVVSTAADFIGTAAMRESNRYEIILRVTLHVIDAEECGVKALRPVAHHYLVPQ